MKPKTFVFLDCTDNFVIFKKIKDCYAFKYDKYTHKITIEEPKPEPRVIYVNEYDNRLTNIHFESLEEAKRNNVFTNINRTVKFIEAIEK